MLYTVAQSPFRNDIQSLLNLLSAKDDILFIEDGVYIAVGDNPLLAAFIEQGIFPYILKEDVEARGLVGQVSDKISMVNYTEFVALTVKHPQHFAW